MSDEQADILDYFLQSLPFVSGTALRQRSASFTVGYSGEPADRTALLEALERFSFYDEDVKVLVPEQTGRALNRSYEDKLVLKVLGRAVRKVFLPVPLQTAWTVFRSLEYLRKGVSCLASGRLQVPVLDAAAITASMLTGDFDTAGSVMFLLDAGEILEDWTYQKSVGDLARSMSLKVDRVWVRPAEGPDYLANLSEVKEGDVIVIRSSDVVPLDGCVADGDITVNQASMTGESVPVPKTVGGYVYAGTVVEEGTAAVRVTRASGSGKYDRIVKMIEESEKLKSETEAKAFHLADSLVPYSFAGAAVTFLLTGNVQRAMSFLMVDFSCALKLSMPLSVLSAIREASEQNISVKGGRFLENYSEAKTILFDKTGTLTRAEPKLEAVIPFNGMDEKECLRLAACLEEHFPHSIARAVVNAAEEQGISHEERHSVVNYVVAHGISSSVDGVPVLIGSYHFIFEDECCRIPEGKQELFDSLPDEYSHLYLASGGELIAVLLIADPIREDAVQVVKQLHELGIDKICMMTGDSGRTAAAVAAKVGIDEYHYELLPEDKASFIRKEHEAGRKVIMVGDGINDTPALSEADVGVAINSGASIAKQLADITISADDLSGLVYTKRLGDALMERIGSNYRFIVGFNGMLIALGVLGILPPASSALLHNGSTILTGLKSMTVLLKE